MTTYDDTPPPRPRCDDPRAGDLMIGHVTFPNVRGHCPACDAQVLFLGAGGYVTCSLAECPEPDAASRQLGAR